MPNKFTKCNALWFWYFCWCLSIWYIGVNKFSTKVLQLLLVGSVQFEVCTYEIPWSYVQICLLYLLLFIFFSSLGSNLQPSINTWENLFAASISVIGLLLFCYLIGNLQVGAKNLSLSLISSIMNWALISCCFGLIDIHAVRRCKSRGTHDWT